MRSPFLVSHASPKNASRAKLNQARTGLVDKKFARLCALGETPIIPLSPSATKFFGAIGLHERPHASPETRTKRGCSHGAKLSRRARQFDRFRNLIREQGFGKSL